MALVDYSDSDGEGVDGAAGEDASPAAKRRKTAGTLHEKAILPPLPATFRDLYSSTVRTSTQDDPSLHGGRKRVTPHVVGNWPTHVYLEWYPPAEEAEVLREVIESANNVGSTKGMQTVVRSLLHNELGVPLPLHVSLSRPLALSTSEKDEFLERLRSGVRASHARTFTVQPLDTCWHPNEDRSRWFFVLRIRRPSGDELRKLLELCNGIAKDFKQPLLYQKPSRNTKYQLPPASSDGVHDSFHISLAWSLQQPRVDDPARVSVAGGRPIDALQHLQINFSQVKVRIGQDVTSCLLPAQRASRKGDGPVKGVAVTVSPDTRLGDMLG